MTTSLRHDGRRFLGAALGALLLVGAGCFAKTETNIDAIEPSGTNGTQIEADADIEANIPDANVNAGVDAATDVKVFKIIAKSWTFQPSEIRVKMGDKVRLEITSADAAHGLAIPAFNVNVKVDASGSAVAEFFADKKGSYPFFCSVFCGSGHKDMKGTLIVE